MSSIVKRRCPTRSGPYQCSKADGHTDDCETEDRPRGLPVGPYRDSFRTRAYVRGAIDFGKDGQLDTIGNILHVRREKDEDDCHYRVRLSRSV